MRESGARSILICGGVAQNRTLRKEISNEAKSMNVSFFAPQGYLNTDNAVMIGVSAFFRTLSKKGDLKTTSQPNLSL